MDQGFGGALSQFTIPLFLVMTKNVRCLRSSRKKKKVVPVDDGRRTCKGTIFRMDCV
jgi:hypothetical protein